MPLYPQIGEAALRFGEYVQNLGDKLLAAKARALQLERERAESNYIGRVFSDYSATVQNAKTPQDILLSATRARSELYRLGTPRALQAGNALDEEMRSRVASISARQQVGVRPRGKPYRLGSNIVQEMEEFYTDTQQPTGSIRYEKFAAHVPSGGGTANTPLETKNILDVKKRALEQSLIPRYMNQKVQIVKRDSAGNVVYKKTINPETKQEEIQYELNPATGKMEPVPEVERVEPANLRKVLIGEHKPYDKDVEEWLRLIGESEALARAHGIAYTPAAALAWAQEHPDKPYPNWIAQQLDQQSLVVGKQDLKKSKKGQVTAPPAPSLPVQQPPIQRKRYASEMEFRAAFKTKMKRDPTPEEIARAKRVGRF